MLQDGTESPVVFDENHKANNVPKKTTLEAKNCSRKDTGIYTITVKNKHGSDSTNIEIVVLGELTQCLLVCSAHNLCRLDPDQNLRGEG